ncbi:AAA domain-containing protein [Gandjariella thermophila]|uniref:DNA2/NAM7 helicase-like C-terminal domain-containing protein n=1 Tax=Gandjariella thermophila TaxID=1931992 RepID=A0A4D4J3Q4_9PSEU|nr:AAA domain-containing protein [Gandjariella thermophila]GDY30094.1 hypothetical protein GTS_17270 [Gandjariella thermophila]
MASASGGEFERDVQRTGQDASGRADRKEGAAHEQVGRYRLDGLVWRRADDDLPGFSGVIPTPRSDDELRDAARRRYGPLRAFLDLAERCAAAGPTAWRAGVVVSGSRWFPSADPLSGELVVRLDEPLPFAAEEGCLLAVCPDGKDERTRLMLAEAQDDVVVLMLPDDADRAAELRRRFAPGTRVVVAQTEHFRLRPHAQALRRFLDGDGGAGGWANLAALLCQPDQLATPAELPEVIPDRRPLGEDQQRAVAGALAAPHAFFVHAPPGTGRTQVIAELVTRLTARGERVLLTAPNPLAVDDVLRRLAGEPGVVPLRLSRKDALVAEDVRGFTKAGYDAMLLKDVRTPANGGVARWEQRLARLAEERAALVAWQDVNAEHAAARQELDDAGQDEPQVDAETLREQREHSAHRLNLVRRQTAQAAAEVTKAQGGELAVEHSLAVRRGRRGPLTWLMELIGMGPAGKMRSAWRGIHRKRMLAVEAYIAVAERYDEELRRHETEVDSLTDREERERNRAADAERTLESVLPRLEEAADRLQRAGAEHLRDDTGAALLRIAELETEEAELTKKLELQRRWFELVGLTGREEARDRERARAAVGRALSGAVNLVCGTTTAFGADPDCLGLDYDTLIVDDANAVTAAEFLIPGRRARRWIMFGDENALPPRTASEDEHRLHAMAALHRTERTSGRTLADAVDDLAGPWRDAEDGELGPTRAAEVLRLASGLRDGGAWANELRGGYAEQFGRLPGGQDAPEARLVTAIREPLTASVFDWCVRNVDSRLRCRLIQQRRMPAEMAELVRVPVYRGRYDTPAPESGEPAGTAPAEFGDPVTFLDTTAAPEPWDTPDGAAGFVNELEADWVRGVCQQWEEELKAGGANGRRRVGVLTFYPAQARLIRRKLGHPRYPGFGHLEFTVVDSIDRLRGQRADVMIVSFCRAFGRPAGKGAPETPVSAVPAGAAPSSTAPRPTATGPAPAGERVALADSPLRTGNGRPPEGFARELRDPRRLAVACTSARQALVLIGHGDTLRRLGGAAEAPESFYANLFRLCERGGVTRRDDWAPGRRGSER